jgi:hypothetical protein
VGSGSRFRCDNEIGCRRRPLYRLRKADNTERLVSMTRTVALENCMKTAGSLMMMSRLEVDGAVIDSAV